MRASALTAMSSSEPLRLPWQPAQMLLNTRALGAGRDVFAGGHLVLLRHREQGLAVAVVDLEDQRHARREPAPSTSDPPCKLAEPSGVSCE